MMLRKKSKKLRTNSESAASWAISYVDLLTLLLCFFIIFFKVDDASKNEDLLNDLAVSLNFNSSFKEKPDSSFALKNKRRPASYATQGEVVSRPSSGVLKNIIIDLEKHNLKINKREKQLVLDFENISFFSSGQKKLNQEGFRLVQKIMKSLIPYKGRIKITVQGHTDQRPLRARKGSYFASDNWELSVLRATSVLKIFIQNGFEAKDLSAEGFADNKRTISSVDDLSHSRRITLKIQEALYENI